ncbi:hypothetical protein QY895_11315 [Latilactobacillus sakei]
MPTRDALDQAAYINGQKVGYLRRLLALGIDYCLLTLIGMIVTAIWRLLKLPTFGNDVFYYCLENGLYFVLLPVLWRGQTPGSALEVKNHRRKCRCLADIQSPIFTVLYHPT